MPRDTARYSHKKQKPSEDAVVDVCWIGGNDPEVLRSPGRWHGVAYFPISRTFTELVYHPPLF